MEIDWSVGQILDALKKNGIEKKTFVVFTSDNGPWLSYGNHGGSAGPLREGKGTTWEGGQRVPCIAWWPTRIKPGSVCNAPAMHIDLFPTIANLLNVRPPKHGVDGRDLAPLFANPKIEFGVQQAYYFYWGNQLQAVRSGKWCLHLPHSYRSLKGEPGKDGIPGPYQQKKTGLALFDLSADVSQKTNLVEEFPEVTKRLQKLADQHAAEIAANKRPRGQL